MHQRFLPEAGHLTPVRSNADYQRILLQLVEGGLLREDMLAVALPLAASADNTAMLDFLLAQGADLRTDGARALAAAARGMAIEALHWLLEHGVDVRADDGAALVAGVASLDEAVVETLLAAGADPRACGGRLVRSALVSRPYDLYSDESDLVDQRGDMLAMLLRHGVLLNGGELAAAMREAPDAREVAVEAAGREGVSPDDAKLLRAFARPS